eukprot:TRINITY_DN28416_c0_g1_i1.p1 TRINITY_DN28416_c0_g1~~TRINITY_DN28416_c0_g1_i1.p1  ORF type:complete len:380 (+),score=80.46 TRINITY_DN28416_c0_g1_i1:81-1220(+)
MKFGVLKAAVSIALFAVLAMPIITALRSEKWAAQQQSAPAGNVLNASELHVPATSGLESFAMKHGDNNWIYASSQTGHIVRFSTSQNFNDSFQILFRTGQDHKDCGKFQFEHICGRPLGIIFSKMGELFIADAYFGILRATEANGSWKIEKIVSEAEGRKIMFPNSIEIDDENRILYFSDSSDVFQRREVFKIISDKRKSGRIIAHDLNENKTSVIAKGIHFPNGVSFSYDKKSLLVCETTRSRILSIDLKDHSISIFSDGLPIVLDNITKSPRGTFWVTGNMARSKTTDFILQLGGIYNKILSFIASKKNTSVNPTASQKAIIVEIDSSGKIISQYIQYPSVGRFAEVFEHNGKIYIGSYANNFILTAVLSELTTIFK